MRNLAWLAARHSIDEFLLCVAHRIDRLLAAFAGLIKRPKLFLEVSCVSRHGFPDILAAYWLVSKRCSTEMRWFFGQLKCPFQHRSPTFVVEGRGCEAKLYRCSAMNFGKSTALLQVAHNDG